MSLPFNKALTRTNISNATKAITSTSDHMNDRKKLREAAMFVVARPKEIDKPEIEKHLMMTVENISQILTSFIVKPYTDKQNSDNYTRKRRRKFFGISSLPIRSRSRGLEIKNNNIFKEHGAKRKIHKGQIFKVNSCCSRKKKLKHRSKNTNYKKCYKIKPFKIQQNENADSTYENSRTNEQLHNSNKNLMSISHINKCLNIKKETRINVNSKHENSNNITDFTSTNSNTNSNKINNNNNRLRPWVRQSKHSKTNLFEMTGSFENIGSNLRDDSDKSQSVSNSIISFDLNAHRSESLLAKRLTWISPQICDSYIICKQKKFVSQLLERFLIQHSCYEDVVHRCRTRNAVEFDIYPREHYKDYSEYHLRNIRRRLSSLIGQTTFRINDKNEMKKLENAIELEKKKKALEHEIKLAENEKKRLQGLMIKGYLDVSEIRQKNRTKSTNSNIIRLNECVKHLPHLTIGEEFKYGTEKEISKNYEKDVKKSQMCLDSGMATATAHALSNATSTIQIIAASKRSLSFIQQPYRINKHLLVGSIPRRCFHSSKLDSSKIIQNKDTQEIKELIEGADNNLSSLNICDIWPAEMLKLFGISNSEY